MIGPRLNAAGRLADMSLGIECLITDDEARALNIAQQLDALNRERREIESGMQEQALLATRIARRTATTPGHRAVRPDWHQGVDRHPRLAHQGKAAPPGVRLRPRRQDGEIKGSGRSIPACTCAMRSTSSPSARPACCCASAATPWPPARRSWRPISSASASCSPRSPTSCSPRPT
jgi:single-stranded DNA-specific DHH superfamily exonuclease